ncbi:hypothetical protein V22_09430 [Calycomorphotria hydatis]|uniref:Uncharacterized protein n=1 Tax=Calycomorphotria hydatis TaxID=2528027 RepID=A0A517T5S9_9PLAN|nr:hypothetical protein V22_09430 [Calycomorphotria hydatis]
MFTRASKLKRSEAARTIVYCGNRQQPVPHGPISGGGHAPVIGRLPFTWAAGALRSLLTFFDEHCGQCVSSLPRTSCSNSEWQESQRNSNNGMIDSYDEASGIRTSLFPLNPCGKSIDSNGTAAHINYRRSVETDFDGLSRRFGIVTDCFFGCAVMSGEPK